MELFRLFGSVVVDGGVGAISQLDALEARAKSAGQTLSNMGSAISNAGQKMTMFATVPIIGALAASVKNASDLNETLSKTEVVFGANAKAMIAFGDNTLRSVGLAKGTALDMAAVFGDMGTSMGLSSDSAFEMSKGLVNLTGDMASFKNMRPDEIHTALSGVFTGETESLKRLGIVMTETNLIEYAKSQGIQKNIRDMTQAEKVQLRYNYVQAQAKNSIGDFQRTQSSAANQMRIFQEGLKESSAKLGALLLPTVTSVITRINQFLQKLDGVNEGLKKKGVMIALVVAAIGPLLVIIGTVVSAIGTIVTAVGTIGLPVIAAIAAITALTVAFGAFLVKTGQVGTFINMVRTAFMNAVTYVKSFVNAILENVHGFDKLITTVKTTVMQGMETFKRIFNDVVIFLTPWAEKLKTAVVPAITNMINEGIKLFNELSVQIGEKIKVIEAVWVKVWPYLQTVLVPILNGIINYIKYGFDLIANVFKLIRQVISGDWSGAWETIKSILWNAMLALWNISSSINQGIINALRGLGGAVSGLFWDAVYAMQGVISNAASNAWQWGSNIISSLANGILSKIQSVRNAASRVASSISDFLGFHSPTKEGAGADSDMWIPNLFNMMLKGVSDGESKIKAAMSNVLSFDKKATLSVGTMGAKGGQQIVLQINNPKVFDLSDIDKLMTPVVNHLKRTGIVGGR